MCNAYEVLTDADKRRVYDRYGEWPAPEPTYERERRSPTRDRDYRHRPFEQSQYSRRPFDAFSDQDFPFGSGFQSHSRSANGANFTDPFTLFNTLFGDLNRQFNGQFNDPFFSEASPFGGAGPSHTSPFGRSRMFPQASLFDTAFPSSTLFPTFPTPPEGRGAGNFMGSTERSFAQSPGGNGQWVSSSKLTTTINGVTQTTWKRIDANVSAHSHLAFRSFTPRRGTSMLRIRIQVAASATSSTV